MGCAFIADYIFNARQEDWLRELTEAHGCKTVNIHFDCEPSTACARYTRRNQEDPRPPGRRSPLTCSSRPSGRTGRSSGAGS